MRVVQPDATPGWGIGSQCIPSGTNCSLISHHLLLSKYPALTLAASRAGALVGARLTPHAVTTDANTRVFTVFANYLAFRVIFSSTFLHLVLLYLLI